MYLAGIGRDRVELRYSPVVIASAMSAGYDEASSVRRPVVLVHI